MTDRFPLIANPTTKQIEELASGDNLNLQNSSIVGATTITSNKFVGNLDGNATSANILNNAANITAGTISSSRLSGYYGISVNNANILNNAENITTGTISSSRLGGSYGIDITGNAATATNLTDAANITTGIINQNRLSGTYNIIVSSASTASNLTPGLYEVNISGNAATATTAINLSGGTITGVKLNISGDSNLGVTTVANLTVTNTEKIGYATITSASIGIGTVGFLRATNLNVSGDVGIGTTNQVTPLQVEIYGTKTGVGTFIASVGIPTTIDSFSVSYTDFKTAEYTIHIGFGSHIQSQKILVMQDKSTAYAQEYAVMYSNSLLVSIGATINNGNCILQATPQSGISGLTTYRFARNTLL